ncbi:MAG: hypothetical protein ABI972_25600 [Acidobacteriota bacterium]
MSQINFHLLDIKDQVNGDKRAIVSGKLGSWMMKVAKLVSGVTAVEITWSTGSGRPSPGPTDIVVYVTTDVDRSVIAVNGGDISEPESNGKVLGFTSANPTHKSALSEVYSARCFSPLEMAGAAFHEAAHNKSLQGNEMHKGQDGLLKSSPDYGFDPSDANLKFFAQFVQNEVKQTIVSQGTLNKRWFTGG